MHHPGVYVEYEMRKGVKLAFTARVIYLRNVVVWDEDVGKALTLQQQESGLVPKMQLWNSDQLCFKYPFREGRFNVVLTANVETSDRV